jgi:cytoskeletal protein RodZ
MGQEIGAGPEAPALSGAEPGDGSIGSFLARQRRLRGMSVDELASLTKIPRRSLERLEAGVFDAMPDGFVRGFVRTVADALGLDPDDAVNRLLREPREDEAAVQARERQRRRRLLLRAGLLAAVLLLLLGLWRASAGWRARDAERPDPVVFRHDAVRALADETEAKQEPR